MEPPFVIEMRAKDNDTIRLLCRDQQVELYRPFCRPPRLDFSNWTTMAWREMRMAARCRKRDVGVRFD